jgi:hypothetical protein
MTTKEKRFFATVVTMIIGILVYAGVGVWTPPAPSLPNIQTQVQSQDDQRLAKLEQAVTALTQAVQTGQRKEARPETTRVAASANTEISRQDLAQIIRMEVRSAVAQESPEAQRAKEEAIAEAKILNTLENKAAYQSASSVVTTAVAAKRWTEEDKENFRAAFGVLTNNQRMELMNILAPAINNGDVKVEVRGPLF